jgi:hypothetical protein
MSEELINHLDRDVARALTPCKGPPRAPTSTGSIHCKLEKVKFPEFFGAPCYHIKLSGVVCVCCKYPSLHRFSVSLFPHTSPRILSLLVDKVNFPFRSMIYFSLVYLLADSQHKDFLFSLKNEHIS